MANQRTDAFRHHIQRRTAAQRGDQTLNRRDQCVERQKLLRRELAVPRRPVVKAVLQKRVHDPADAEGRLHDRGDEGVAFFHFFEGADLEDHIFFESDVFGADFYLCFSTCFH